MLELNRLYLMDCMEGMAQIPDKYFELAIVDPPYGVGDFKQSTGNRRKYNRDWKINWNNATPEEQYFNELYRVSKERIIWGCNYYLGMVRDKGVLVWDKGNESGIGSQCELASLSMRTRVEKYFLQWTGFCNGTQEGRKIHPCQKPVALYKWLLANYAKPGDKILDTHVGSASSLIACYDMGFDYMGFEIDPDYHAAATKRLAEHMAQVRLPLPTVAAEQTRI
jgi:site-specific DNA-methyltransferase (adenine-specific)